MAQTIEAFISRLQNDGVQAGQQAAAKIKSDAEGQAARIIQDAEARGKKLIEDAKAEAEKIRQRSETELKLAARDTIIRLQEAVVRAIESVMFGAAKDRLGDTDLIGGLLKDIVKQYVEADLSGQTVVTLNVSEETRNNLKQWALDKLHHKEGAFVLHGTLKTAGFEYKVIEGTVEVTLESVGEILSGMVGPQVRKLIGQAVAKGQAAEA